MSIKASKDQRQILTWTLVTMPQRKRVNCCALLVQQLLYQRLPAGNNLRCLEPCRERENIFAPVCDHRFGAADLLSDRRPRFIENSAVTLTFKTRWPPPTFAFAVNRLAFALSEGSRRTVHQVRAVGCAEQQNNCMDMVGGS